jgi:transcriptional regulator with XRE-family HTH domain
MSEIEAALTVRSKILGVLLKDARVAAGRSARECAEALGCAASTYNAYERGDKSPSLPELELMAYFLDLPLDHFWGSRVRSEGQGEDRRQIPAAPLISLRDRIIGAQLRKARTAARLKLRDLAAELGLASGRLSAYEFGQKPIPLPVLEALASRLSLNIEDLLERQGTVGEWDSTHREFERFSRLAPELREFVSQPVNESFLRLALQLSQMPADKLRGIAASLLDITY